MKHIRGGKVKDFTSPLLTNSGKLQGLLGYFEEIAKGPCIILELQNKPMHYGKLQKVPALTRCQLVTNGRVCMIRIGFQYKSKKIKSVQKSIFWLHLYKFLISTLQFVILIFNRTVEALQTEEKK